MKKTALLLLLVSGCAAPARLMRVELDGPPETCFVVAYNTWPPTFGDRECVARAPTHPVGPVSVNCRGLGCTMTSQVLSVPAVSAQVVGNVDELPVKQTCVTVEDTTACWADE